MYSVNFLFNRCIFSQRIQLQSHKDLIYGMIRSCIRVEVQCIHLKQKLLNYAIERPVGKQQSESARKWRMETCMRL